MHLTTATCSLRPSRSAPKLSSLTIWATFPDEALAPWSIETKTPDDFVLDLIDFDARVVYSRVQQIVDERRNPPESVDEVLGQLERAGMAASVAELRLGRT